MATIITGIVFNDLNHNGQFDPGEPGIPNVRLTLLRVSNGTCVQTTTSANGRYSFTVQANGIYRIYETVAANASCPPSTFTQPMGFFFSNGPRERTIIVDDDDENEQFSNHPIIDNQNFSHDALNDPLDCTTTMIQFVNTPTQWFDIDVVTGVSTFRGLLNPADDVNAIGYNILDGYLYGYDQTTHHIVRIDSDRNVTQLIPNPPGLPSNDFNVGALDLDGHLFLMVNDTARFYTVNLNSNSPTFLKLVDPTNGFVEETGNFGTALSATLNISDWSFNPNDGFLYGVRSVGNTAQVMRVNPANGTVTGLTTTIPTLNPTGRSWGAVAMDASGAMFAIYNGDGGVYRFTISGNTAVGDRISTTFSTSFNDAAMCPAALVGPIADVAVDKDAFPDNVSPGDTLTYTITVSNHGPDSAEHVTLDDIVPAVLLNPQYSINGSPFLPWPGTLDLGTFDAEESEVVTIRGTLAASASGLISNTATVESDAADPNPDNNTDTADVSAVVAADMSVVKMASPNPVAPGGTLTYTLTVHNAGPADALNVMLTDAIPAVVQNPQFSVNGDVFQPWTGSVDLGTFANGQTVIVEIRGTVDPDAEGRIVNTALVASITPDPNPNNNTDTIETDIGVFVCDARCQAITDLIESVALQETAIAHILNAEGEKLQAVITDPNATPAMLLEVNRSVQSMTSAVTLLENALLSKLTLFGDCLCTSI